MLILVKPYRGKFIHGNQFAIFIELLMVISFGILLGISVIDMDQLVIYIANWVMIGLFSLIILIQMLGYYVEAVIKIVKFIKSKWSPQR